MVSAHPDRYWSSPHNLAEVAMTIAFLNHTELGPANLMAFMLVKMPCEFRASFEKGLECDPSRYPRSRRSPTTVARWPLVARGHRAYRSVIKMRPGCGSRSRHETSFFSCARTAAGPWTFGFRFPAMTAAQARVRTAEVLDKIDKGEDHRRPRKCASGATLAEAWDYHRKSLERGRRPRSLRTIQAYERAFGMLKSLHDVPLRVLANDPQRALEEHERISEEHPTTADATMRFLRRVTAPMQSLDWIQHFAPKCILQVPSSGTIVKAKRKVWGREN